MTAEYHDEPEDDTSSFWTREPTTVSSGFYRFRRWLFPALTATVIIIFIIAVGASNTKTLTRLSSLEETVSNLTVSLTSAQRLTTVTAKDVGRLKFAVDNNKDQLTSVSEALKQLSVLDTLSRTVSGLKCSFERFVNNGTTADGCCALGWDLFRTSCYFFSKEALNWNDARDWCNGHESHLLILSADEEWDFVVGHALGNFYWVGLTDERTGEWEWVNQTPYVMERRRWRPGQPDNWTGHGLGSGNEDCAHLHHDGRLNDLHCLTRMRFICQRHSQRS